MDYPFILEMCISFVITYLIGSISFGYLVGKESGVDIRKSGSGNTGTTNALRTLGIKAGLITFAGDLFKALIPVMILKFLSQSVFNNSDDMTYIITIIAGIGAVLGHNFPFWMGFKGGKGIAVTAGVTVAISFSHPLYWIIAFIIFVIIVALTRYVSLGSLCVPAWAVLVYTLIYERGNEYFVIAVCVSLLYTLLAFVKHASNIKRLATGTENKLFGKKEA